MRHVLALGVLGAVLWGGALAGEKDPSPAPAPAAPAQPAPPAADRNEGYASEQREKIKGREDQPARDVFKNVKVMGDVPAGRLLRIMQMGFARGLGVSCTHCHETGNFASDAKEEKIAARGMMGLVRTINDDLLPRIAGLDEDDEHRVNCTTCHRGQVKPALDLEPPAR
jgi:hypothetical protein